MLQVCTLWLLPFSRGCNKTEECCDKFHLEVEKKNELTKNGK